MQHTGMIGQVERLIGASISVKQDLLADAVAIQQIVAVADAAVRSIEAGGKLILFGNGGSAGDAQHIAAEFVGRFAMERRALPALALSVNTSCLTAIGNDYGYDQSSRDRWKRSDVPETWPSESPRAGNRSMSCTAWKRPELLGCTRRRSPVGRAARSSQPSITVSVSRPPALLASRNAIF